MLRSAEPRVLSNALLLASIQYTIFTCVPRLVNRYGVPAVRISLEASRTDCE
jgi:hypothetical protein